MRKICNNVLKNKCYLNDYFSYIWIKQIIFSEVKYLYELECNLIILEYKLPNVIIDIIRRYLETNLISNNFFNLD